MTSLTKLLAHHEQVVAAIRLTMSELDGQQRNGKKAHMNGMISSALKVEASRNGHGPKKKPKLDLHAQRKRTAALLGKFDTMKPFRPENARGISVFVKNGYLRAKGAGWVRTRKPFEIKAPR